MFSSKMELHFITALSLLIDVAFSSILLSCNNKGFLCYDEVTFYQCVEINKATYVTGALQNCPPGLFCDNSSDLECDSSEKVNTPQKTSKKIDSSSSSPPKSTVIQGRTTSPENFIEGTTQLNERSSLENTYTNEILVNKTQKTQQNDYMTTIHSFSEISESKPTFASVSIEFTSKQETFGWEGTSLNSNSSAWTSKRDENRIFDGSTEFMTTETIMGTKTTELSDGDRKNRISGFSETELTKGELGSTRKQEYSSFDGNYTIKFMTIEDSTDKFSETVEGLDQSEITESITFSTSKLGSSETTNEPRIYETSQHQTLSSSTHLLESSISTVSEKVSSLDSDPTSKNSKTTENEEVPDTSNTMAENIQMNSSTEKKDETIFEKSTRKQDIVTIVTKFSTKNSEVSNNWNDLSKTTECIEQNDECSTESDFKDITGREENETIVSETPPDSEDWGDTSFSSNSSALTSKRGGNTEFKRTETIIETTDISNGNRRNTIVGFSETDPMEEVSGTTRKLETSSSEENPTTTFSVVISEESSQMTDFSNLPESSTFTVATKNDEAEKVSGTMPEKFSSLHSDPTSLNSKTLYFTTSDVTMKLTKLTSGNAEIADTSNTEAQDIQNNSSSEMKLITTLGTLSGEPDIFTSEAESSTNKKEVATTWKDPITNTDCIEENNECFTELDINDKTPQDSDDTPMIHHDETFDFISTTHRTISQKDLTTHMSKLQSMKEVDEVTEYPDFKANYTEQKNEDDDKTLHSKNMSTSSGYQYSKVPTEPSDRRLSSYTSEYGPDVKQSDPTQVTDNSDGTKSMENVIMTTIISDLENTSDKQEKYTKNYVYISSSADEHSTTFSTETHNEITKTMMATNHSYDSPVTSSQTEKLMSSNTYSTNVEGENTNENIPEISSSQDERIASTKILSSESEKQEVTSYRSTLDLISSTYAFKERSNDVITTKKDKTTAFTIIGEIRDTTENLAVSTVTKNSSPTLRTEEVTNTTGTTIKEILPGSTFMTEEENVASKTRIENFSDIVGIENSTDNIQNTEVLSTLNISPNGFDNPTTIIQNPISTNIISGTSTIQKSTILDEQVNTTEKMSLATTSVNKPITHHSIASSLPPTIFKCPSVGKFPDPVSCTKFHVCINGIFDLIDVTNECPERSQFDSYNKECTLDPVQCPSEPPLVCTGSGIFKHPFQCGRYYRCTWNYVSNNYQLKQFRCPDSYEFNARNRRCVKSDRCQSNSVDFECVQQGKFPVEKNCRQYYECSRNHNRLVKRLRSCRRSDLFDRNSSRCRKQYLVKCPLDMNYDDTVVN